MQKTFLSTVYCVPLWGKQIQEHDYNTNVINVMVKLYTGLCETTEEGPVTSYI